MFLGKSINPHETWKAVEGGHEGTHFQSVGHWLLLHQPDPAGPMFQELAPSDPLPPRTFTPAVLHPVFSNGPWDRGSRMEAFNWVPPASRFGPQSWESAVMLPAISEQGSGGVRSALLNAFTADPRCFEADVRLSYGMRSGLFRSKGRHIQSTEGLKLRDVYDALDQLSRELYCEATSEKKQNLIRRELRIFMPCDIHPVTDQEWEYVRSLQARL